MSNVYSSQLVNLAGTFGAVGVVPLFDAFDTTTRTIVRDVTGGFVFGGSATSLTLYLQPGGTGSLIPIVVWDDSTPNPFTREMRLVLNTNDELAYQVLGPGAPALGGLVISGYVLTLP